MPDLPFDDNEFDIQLHHFNYRIRGYSRSEISTFIPRFGAGEQTDSQFDLLRSASIKGFAGGELQRRWEDDTSVYGIQGLENRYDDGVMYPNKGLELINGGDVYPSGKVKLLAWCTSGDYMFIAYRTYDTPTTYVWRVNPDGTGVALTTTVALRASSDLKMLIYNDALWLYSPTYDGLWLNSYRVNTTIVNVTAGSGYFSNLIVYRGQMYGLGTGTIGGNRLYRYTGTTSTRSYEKVGELEKDDMNGELAVYNNRIIWFRKDGMYGYDGIQLNPIEDLSNSDLESEYNYHLPRVLKGYLYYFMPDGYYRFNGSLIEKLYDVSEIGFPIDACIGQNKIWYLYTNTFPTAFRYDKSMGYDLASDQFHGRVVTFDGKSMVTYDRTITTAKDTVAGGADFDGQGGIDKIVFYAGTVYVTTNYTRIGNNLYQSRDSAPSTRSVVITTSIFDGDFPQINKHLEEIEITLDGTYSGTETFTIQCRNDSLTAPSVNFEGAGTWLTIGTCVVNGNKLMPLYDSGYVDGITFRRIQFRITGNIASGTGIEKFIVRYTLKPTYKTQWNMTLLCYGDDEYGRLRLQDGSDPASWGTVQQLRGNIYTLRNNDNPVWFTDVDYMVATSSASDSAVSIDCDPSILKSHKDVFVRNGLEIMKVTDRSGTAIQVERGFNSDAEAVEEGKKLYLCYRVYLRQIQNERIELYEEERADGVAKNQDSEITIVLQEI